MDDGTVQIGDAVSAGLLAGEIQRADAGQPAISHDLHEACANCGTIRQELRL